MPAAQSRSSSVPVEKESPFVNSHVSRRDERVFFQGAFSVKGFM